MGVDAEEAKAAEQSSEMPLEAQNPPTQSVVPANVVAPLELQDLAARRVIVEPPEEDVERQQNAEAAIQE